MWSAIPVALLYMTVNLSEGSKAAAPKGTKFVLPELIEALERADLGCLVSSRLAKRLRKMAGLI